MYEEISIEVQKNILGMNLKQGNLYIENIVRNLQDSNPNGRK